MGLLQKAVETYDAHQKYVGESREKHETLAPICHTIQKAQVEITLDKNGAFVSANEVSDESAKTLIPATEDSAGRAGKNAFMVAHPLCEQLGYLIATPNYYLPGLEKWANSAHSHPKLIAVLSYVKNQTILSDLERSGLISTKNGTLTSGKIRGVDFNKCLIRWKVVGMNDSAPPECWKDKTLFEAYISYHLSKTPNVGNNGLCMISGEMGRLTKNNPRGIIPWKSGAKLISANDSSGFTYRGRFTDETQAATVSYLSSQKAHAALRWLVAEQGVYHGGRTFLCWNPQGTKLPSPVGVFRRRKNPSIKPSEYREDLLRTLNGWKSTMPEDRDGVVIAAFDAATTGRLSLTYYNELKGSDFLQRLHDWDAWCCWPHRPYGIEAPSLFQIVSMAFGTLQNGKFETRDVVLREQMQRMMSCRVDRARFPTDVERALVNRASRLMLYGDDKKANYLRGEMLFTVCAVIRKYRHDHKKEEWEMSLEAEKRNRSYQYGRLLAVFEKVERDTYGSDEAREPNAIRMQSAYCQRPLSAAGTIEKQLERAYFPRLKPGSRVYYKNLIGSILEVIHSFPETEWNRPLEDTYLMGYYLQRSELYRSKKETTEQEEN